MSAVSDYIRQLQGYEEHAFSLEELRISTQISDSTLRKELNRLSAKGEVLNLRKGFFLIVSPRYQNVGCLLYTSPSPRDRTRSRMPSSA